jgi:hypothetical protein
MANEVKVDASQMVEFGFDLGRIASSALPRVDDVVKHAAQNVKDDMVSDAQSSRHFRGIGRTIDYDRAYGIGQVAYEVGPNRARGGQAPLAGDAYLGGANGGGGSLDLDGPAEREAPRMMKALLDLLGDLR